MITKLLISSSVEERVGEISKILSLNFPHYPNHPDVLYFKAGEKLGIEQARKIKEHFSLKPYSAKGRAVVLEDAVSLTVEAQNALLKTLEEPAEESILLLGASSDADLLPTVLSRVEVVILSAKHLRGEDSDDPSARHLGGGVEQSQSQKDLEKLLSSSLEDRFTYVEKLKEREQFLHFMVAHFRDKLIRSASDRSISSSKDQIKFFVQELLEVEKWAAQNVNLRAILEYLMLVMPKVG